MDVSKQKTLTEIEKTIEARRSVVRVSQEPVAREYVERILSSAVHAPNHRITEPWLFHVFVGKGRGELARARAETAHRMALEEGDEEDLISGRVSRERKKAFRAPVVIAVISRHGRDDVETLENYAACAAAAQNMQLTAHALGLGVIWRTGPVAYHQHMRDFFELEDDDRIVAYLYVGYPDMGERPRRRSPAFDKTTWYEGDVATPAG